MEIKFEFDKLQKQKLFVATPMYGGACAGMFTKSCTDLSAFCAAHNIPLQFYFLFNESLITRARNYCVDEFMRSGADHLMFIDSDIGFNAQDIIAMMVMQGNEPEKYQIIGGPYPKKCISWEKIKKAVDKGVADTDPNVLERFVGDYVFNPKGGSQTIQISEPCEVLEIGTGFMMVHRTAMQKFYDTFPQYMYKPDHVRTEHFDGTREIMQAFQAEVDQLDFKSYYEQEMKRVSEMKLNDPEAIQAEIEKVLATAQEINSKKSKRYLSEDYWFCQKAQEANIKTWFCPWMRLQHVGSYIFGGSLADLAAIGASATADPSALGKTKVNRKPER
jgi:hypothetical protein